MHILEILLIMRECSFYKCNISMNISNIQSQSQNCHLATTWLKELETLIEESTNSHSRYRLWILIYPIQNFPILILQKGVYLFV